MKPDSQLKHRICVSIANRLLDWQDGVPVFTKKLLGLHEAMYFPNKSDINKQFLIETLIHELRHTSMFDDVSYIINTERAQNKQCGDVIYWHVDSRLEQCKPQLKAAWLIVINSTAKKYLLPSNCQGDLTTEQLLEFEYSQLNFVQQKLLKAHEIDDTELYKPLAIEKAECAVQIQQERIDAILGKLTKPNNTKPLAMNKQKQPDDDLVFTDEDIALFNKRNAMPWYKKLFA